MGNRNHIALHLTCMDSLKFGGIEKYLLSVARHLRSSGFKTILQYESLPFSETYLGEAQKVGLQVHVLPLNTNPIAALVKVLWLFYSYRPLYVHVHFPSGGTLYAVAIASLLYRDVKLLATIHSTYSRHTIQRRLRAYRCFTKICCVSRTIAESFISCGLREGVVSTKYLGIEPAPLDDLRRVELRHRLGIEVDAKIIGTVIFENPVKGGDILLEALKQLPERHSEVEVLIIGVDPQGSRLVELAKTLGIDQRIRWLGIVDNARQFLPALDIYVQPSRSEGLPLAVLEAMQAGLPVVASNVGGLVEAVVSGFSGFLTAPESGSELAAALTKLLDSASLSALMGERSRKMVEEKFSLECCTTALVREAYGA